MGVRSVVVVVVLGLLACGGFVAVRELTKPTPPIRVPAIDIDPEAGAENLEPDAAERRAPRERRRERERERRRRDDAAREGSSEGGAATDDEGGDG